VLDKYIHCTQISVLSTTGMKNLVSVNLMEHSRVFCCCCFIINGYNPSILGPDEAITLQALLLGVLKIWFEILA